ncbi:MAG TPA: hypothetical protein VN520_20995 [Streptomyces sp.]|uniref:hypothetical protein n=1 Tax=Streptomyces sp. TaxID=1931 RepID=UPI002CBDEBF6|nr:hypothetical protein [Streptomyces sp.]HWU08825.1 hypothetical protein [Streptomyces sp.]
MVPHGLCHGHKVWLDEQGRPRGAVEERMGHRLKGVEGTYSHASPEMEFGIAKGLRRAWPESFSEDTGEVAERRGRRSS